jgi:hypothetical protein
LPPDRKAVLLAEFEAECAALRLELGLTGDW